jgi:hypothetical protein
MAKISLATYSLRIGQRHRQGNLPLEDIKIQDDVPGEDLFAWLNAYFNDRSADYTLDEEEQKALRVTEHKSAGRDLSGIVQTGEWGYESPLLDIDAGEVLYTRSTHEAGLIPFYYLARLPKGADEGIVVLQRFQNLGIRKILLTDLQRYFEENHPDFTLRINPIVSPEVWRAYLGEGRLLTVRFIRFSIPDDIADAVSSGGHIEDIGKIEYVLTARRNGALPFEGRIRDFIEGRRHWDDFIELTDFEYETVKVEVDFHGSKRTLELTDVQNVRALYDVTDVVTFGDDGHPTFASIDKLGKEYAGDLGRAIGSG